MIQEKHLQCELTVSGYCFFEFRTLLKKTGFKHSKNWSVYITTGLTHITLTSSGYLNRSSFLVKNQLASLTSVQFTTCYPMNTYIYNDLIEITSDWSPEIIFLPWYSKELTGKYRPASSIYIRIESGPFTVRASKSSIEVLILLKWHTRVLY